MSNYFRVKPLSFGRAHITSASPKAQQVILGWGDGASQNGAQFYGQPSGRRGANGPEWEWTLSATAIGELVRLIETHLHDSNFYSNSEYAAARELLSKLGRIALATHQRHV